MKSRATGYTDFYKNASGGASDSEDEETITPTTRPSLSVADKKSSLAAARKRAIKRRLQAAR
jgi:hypothetical protein